MRTSRHFKGNVKVVVGTGFMKNITFMKHKKKHKRTNTQNYTENHFIEIESV